MRTLPMRAWTQLVIEPDHTVSEAMDYVKEHPHRRVRAATLCLALSAENAWKNVENMVLTCQGVSEIRFEKEPVNALAVATLLDQKRAVTALTCALETNGPEETAQSLVLLHKNKSLTRIEAAKDVTFWVGRPQPLDPVSWLSILKMAVGNRLLRPDLMGRGAGRGMGVSTQGRFGANNDVFEHIGSFLDFRSALALSGISKAAYLGSRRAMQQEIQRLSDLLAPEMPFATFVDAMAAREDKGLLGPMPDPSTSDGSTFDRQWALREAGVPDAVVDVMLGRRLAALIAPVDKAHRILSEAQGQQVWQLLEALACHGAIPAQVWLQQGLGISLTNAEPDGLAQGV
ncbi:hypothetical protein [Hydrogenophaga sp.]|uniref:hypothetical protein n=1 Tax=Hydrogenophaga sp. TaxID=1904254 RepID=UPI00272B1452|nr:hypothetical protein [Hydrogenophaga sp.]